MKRLLAGGLRSPLGIYAVFFLGALATLALARLGLLAWQWDRVSEVPGLGRIFLLGLRLDLVLLCYLAAIPALLHLALPVSRWRARLAVTLLTAAGVLILFMELATPEFMREFDGRPDRLFFEYLETPREVFGMLWANHRPALLSIPLAVSLAVVLQWRLWHGLVERERAWTWQRRAAVAPLLVAALLVGMRGLDHRPLNLSHAAFSANRLANQLVPNSTYTLFYALYAQKQETDTTARYGRMPMAEIVERVQRYTRAPRGDFTDPALPTVRRTGVAERKGPKLNLVIMLQESLGAPFVGHLGGLPLTPNLDALSREAWTFTRLYATGTRTARGMEAVATGFAPTPSPAVLKLPRAQHGFFTLAGLLHRHGYTSDFVYGGVANFDNMRGFYLANGFDRVIEQGDFEDPAFLGSWGVSDEDWVDKAHETFLEHGDQPFFAIMLSTSNHDPFEYPLGRIEPYEQPDYTRHNAMKYADYAIGRFFDKARGAPYFRNTVFVVLADHDARVYGDDFVPVSHFHIPGLILGPGIEPRRDARIASQLDLGPTLLHLLGIADVHPMTGRDLVALPPDDAGLALMQFNDQHGFRYGNRLVVHEPGPIVRQFVVDAEDRLTPAPVDPELERDALAHALWPAEAYKNGLYRLPADTATAALGPRATASGAAGSAAGR